MDEQTKYTAFGIAITAVFTGIGYIIKELYAAKQRDKERIHREAIETESLALRNQSVMMRRQEQQIVRMEEYAEKLHCGMRKLYDLVATRREEVAEWRGKFFMLYDWAKRAYAEMEKAGVKMEKPTGPPVTAVQRGAESAMDEADHTMREMDQSSVVLKAVRPKPPPKEEDAPPDSVQIPPEAKP
jgi:hypothetical protein